MTSFFPTLTINLTALRANYNLLRMRHAKKSLAAVVKADAYGLGVEGIALTLWQEGQHDFFVATLAEAIELRTILPEARIGVFQGFFAGEEKEYVQHKLIPVLNDIPEVERFAHCNLWRENSPVIIHIDTGMTRLGLSETDLKHPTLSNLSTLQTLHSTLIMSHLACANDPVHPKNSEQLARFKRAIKHFPNAKYSLANSAGIFLPDDFHFDIARPGCALYGINPYDGVNPMQHVATLSAPIFQIRTLDRDETIGYGATTAATKGSRVAVVGIGYADGYFRSLGNQSFAYIAGHKVPLVGRVSMDMVELDISEVPETKITANTRAEFINDRQTVDAIAAQCNTIGYEIFTRIGNRVQRIYS